MGAASILDVIRDGSLNGGTTLAATTLTPFERLLLPRPSSTLAEAKTGANRNKVAALARVYLLIEPLSSVALSRLVVTETGQPDQSAVLFAERLSRRNPEHQIQLAGKAALAGQIGQSIEHIDRALKVSPGLATRILPGLVPAVADPSFSEALSGFSDRPWFWHYLVLTGNDEIYRAYAGDLVVENKAQLKSASPSVLREALKILVKGNRIREATQVAIASERISNEALATFIPTTQNSLDELVPLTWQLANSDLAKVTLDADGTWHATIEPGRRATLMQRVTSLDAGQYKFRGQFETRDEAARIRIAIRCVGADTTAIAAEPRQGSESKITFTIEFAIPRGCAGQHWSIDASTLSSREQVILKGRNFVLGSL